MFSPAHPASVRTSVLIAPTASASSPTWVATWKAGSLSGIVNDSPRHESSSAVTKPTSRSAVTSYRS